MSNVEILELLKDIDFAQLVGNKNISEIRDFTFRGLDIEEFNELNNFIQSSLEYRYDMIEEDWSEEYKNKKHQYDNLSSISYVEIINNYLNSLGLGEMSCKIIKSYLDPSYSNLIIHLVEKDLYFKQTWYYTSYSGWLAIDQVQPCEKVPVSQYLYLTKEEIIENEFQKTYQMS